MECKMSQAKLLMTIEWILFFLLCCLSCYFMIGVLNEYLSESTSFTISSKPITVLPTVTICLSSNGKFHNDVEYEYKSDFQIEYHVDWKKSIGFLKEGMNFNRFNETINFEKIITVYFGTCYKLTAMPNFIKKGRYISLIFYFNESIPHEKLPHIRAFYTSEKNAFGIMNAYWSDGTAKSVFIEKDVYVQSNLKVVKHDYLKLKSICRDEPFFECFAKILNPRLNECPKKCSKYSLPYVQICETNEEIKCSDEQFWNVWLGLRRGQYNESNLCAKACETVDYIGEETGFFNVSSYYNGATHGIAYQFDPPETVTLHEEYLIHNDISLIAYIGGTLGMCIGFSFTNVVTSILNFVQKGYSKLPNKHTGIIKVQGGTNSQF